MAALESAAQRQIVARRMYALHVLGVRAVQSIERVDQRRFGERPSSRIQAKDSTQLAAEQRSRIASHLAAKTVPDQCHFAEPQAVRLQMAQQPHQMLADQPRVLGGSRVQGQRQTRPIDGAHIRRHVPLIYVGRAVYPRSIVAVEPAVYDEHDGQV